MKEKNVKIGDYIQAKYKNHPNPLIISGNHYKVLRHGDDETYAVIDIPNEKGWNPEHVAWLKDFRKSREGY